MMGVLKRIAEHKKLALFVIVLIAIGAFIFYKSKTAVPEFKTLIVKRDNLSVTINASGQIKTKNQATMGFLSTGRLAAINFKEGNPVKKGAVIASLNSTQQVAAVSVEQADFNSAQSALDLVLDNIHLSQYGMGGFANVGSSNETQTQKTARQEAQMTRDAAYQNLQSAETALSMTTIIAPFDGVISDISNMEPGQNITATSGASVTLIGKNEYKFVADVDEIEFRSLVSSESGEIILDAYPDDKFKGIITFIGVAAVKLSTGGSVIPVELSLENNEKLLNGLNGEVTFTKILKENVISLPKTAVRKDQGAEYVFILSDKKAVRKNITVGETLGNQVEITTGLTEGDKVILGDVHPD